jgi:hypothetical protein
VQADETARQLGGVAGLASGHQEVPPREPGAPLLDRDPSQRRAFYHAPAERGNSRLLAGV